MTDTLVEKVCSHCKQTLAAAAFCRSSQNKSGLASWCKTCTASQHREAGYGKKWRESNPERTREIQRKSKYMRNYGITVERYETMLAEQDERCAICRTGTPGRGRIYFFVDHDHVTNEVRGLLCGDCNTGLGMFRDSPEALRSAILYLNTDGEDD